MKAPVQPDTLLRKGQEFRERHEVHRMLYFGVDHHMKTSHLTVTNESGEILKRTGIPTKQGDLVTALEEFK